MRWLLLASLISPALISGTTSARGAAMPAAAAAVAPAPETDAPPPPSRYAAQRAAVTIKVVHPTETRQAVLEKVQAAGGFQVIVTSQQLQVKVPPANFSDVLDAVKASGLVVDQHLERQDRTAHIADLEARLRAKEEILGRLRGFFDKSDLSSTLRIERELLQLVTEIEQVKGELRVQREQTRWAVIDVTFHFRQRDRIRYEHSAFEWLNTVHLDRFLGEF